MDIRGTYFERIPEPYLLQEIERYKEACPYVFSVHDLGDRVVIFSRPFEPVGLSAQITWVKGFHDPAPILQLLDGIHRGHGRRIPILGGFLSYTRQRGAPEFFISDSSNQVTFFTLSYCKAFENALLRAAELLQ